MNIILDPGLAFGTGEHPTTQLCLRWLHHVVKGGECILDYGTGSGILAIAALKVRTLSRIALNPSFLFFECMFFYVCICWKCKVGRDHKQCW